MAKKSVRLGKAELMILRSCAKNPNGTYWPGRKKEMLSLRKKGLLTPADWGLSQTCGTDLTDLGWKVLKEYEESKKEPEPQETPMEEVAVVNPIRYDDLEHKYPLGQVVEVEYDDGTAVFNIFQDANGKEIVLRFKGTATLIIVGHGRDCDGSPLYHLSTQPIKFGSTSIAETFRYRQFVEFLATNWGESSLKPVEGQVVPMKWDSIDDYITEIFQKR